MTRETEDRNERPGDWHFSRGRQLEHPTVDIDFDDIADSEPTWRDYVDALSFQDSN